MNTGRVWLQQSSRPNCAAAETALVRRARELFHSAVDNIEEEHAIDDAMDASYALRSALKYRPCAKNVFQDLAA